MKSKKNKVIIIMLVFLLILVIGIVSVLWYFDSIKHLGIWNMELEVYDKEEKLIRDELIKIELKEDNSFNYCVKDQLNGTTTNLLGKYKRVKKSITLDYDDENKLDETFYLKEDHLYFYNDNQTKYLTKEMINILKIPELYNVISYDEYLKLFDEKKSEIIIVSRDNCVYCRNLKNTTLIDIYSKYNMKFYQIDSEKYGDKLDISGVPTTYFLKDGQIVDKIFGYVDYHEFNKKMKDNNY